MSAFFAAVQFLLVSPVLIRRPFTPRELGGATGFYPLVGLLLGGLLVLADLLLARLFPVQVRSALILALWIALTGALHFDGFLDSCDGLLGGGTADHRLEIMRDERTGAYGLAGGALILLILFSSLNVIEGPRFAALLLAPVLGRWAITLAVVAFPYVRPVGLGRDIKDNAHAPQVIVATLTALALAGGLSLLLHSYAPVLALGLSALVWWLSAQRILRLIAGMTGDTYGAINMLVETTVLLTFAAAR